MYDECVKNHLFLRIRASYNDEIVLDIVKHDFKAVNMD